MRKSNESKQEKQKAVYRRHDPDRSAAALGGMLLCLVVLAWWLTWAMNTG
jgi:hypothetical protein